MEETSHGIDGTIKKYIWNYLELLSCNFMGILGYTVGAGISNTFGIPMVALCSVSQWRSVFQLD